jgi:hypothetical protein
LKVLRELKVLRAFGVPRVSRGRKVFGVLRELWDPRVLRVRKAFGVPRELEDLKVLKVHRASQVVSAIKVHRVILVVLAIKVRRVRKALKVHRVILVVKVRKVHKVYKARKASKVHKVYKDHRDLLVVMVILDTPVVSVEDIPVHTATWATLVAEADIPVQQDRHQIFRVTLVAQAVAPLVDSPVDSPHSVRN